MAAQPSRASCSKRRISSGFNSGYFASAFMKLKAYEHLLLVNQGYDKVARSLMLLLAPTSVRPAGRMLTLWLRKFKSVASA